MAKRRIAQETFDAAVRENMEEFGMDAEEAVKEAVEQFQYQGVDVSCIVKVPPTSINPKEDQTHKVLRILDSLRVGQETALLSEIMPKIKSFTEECMLGFPQRHLAARNSAYPVVLSYCKKFMDAEDEDVVASLSALGALTEGQPDLFDAEGKRFLLDVISRHQDSASVTVAALIVVQHCCLKHENNRQDLVKDGLLSLLIAALTRHSESAEVVKEASTTIRGMTLDDDVRVVYGHAHDNAKSIVLELNGLQVLIEAANAHIDNPSLLGDLCATISRLAVRNEFCQDICDLGGLKLMTTVLANNFEIPELIRQVLSAIRAIAGNDEVKDAVAQSGGVQLIVMVMNKHIKNSGVCEQGCACLAALALRKPNICAVIMEEGGATAAVEAMKSHPDAVHVQKQACMMLRNVVSRKREFCKPILDMGAESLIQQAMQKHTDCSDEGKAALRDLGCKVDLQEPWTGKHGGLTQ